MSNNNKVETPKIPEAPKAPAFMQASSSSASATPANPNPVSGGSESIEDTISRRFGKPRSALGPGTVIQGKLSFDTTVVIEGKLGGEVYSTETLIVGKLGSVNAQVRVKNLVVAGVVTGNIVASECIELLRGGKIEGDFTTKRLVIEEGSVFNGSCKMSPEAQSETTVKETNLSADELKKAADMAKNGASAKPQQQQQAQPQPQPVRPNP